MFDAELQGCQIKRMWMKRGTIGRGTFATVFEYELGDQRLAFKRMRSGTTEQGLDLHGLAELRALTELQPTEAVVRLVGSFVHKRSLYLVQERCRCDLDAWLRSGALCATARPATIRALIAQLVACVAAIHDHGWMHRDLKPGNVLVRIHDPPSISATASSSSSSSSCGIADHPSVVTPPSVVQLCLADLGQCRPVPHSARDRPSLVRVTGLADDDDDDDSDSEMQRAYNPLHPPIASPGPAPAQHPHHDAENDDDQQEAVLRQFESLSPADREWFRLGGRPGRMCCQVGTLWYRAPELLLGAPRHDHRVDLWSLGLVIFEMLQRHGSQRLFEGPSDMAQLSEIQSVLGIITQSRWPAVARFANYVVADDELASSSDAVRSRIRELLVATRVTHERRRRSGSDVTTDQPANPDEPSSALAAPHDNDTEEAPSTSTEWALLLDQGADLIAQLLQYDPLARPSARHLLHTHAFFAPLAAESLGLPPVLTSDVTLPPELGATIPVRPRKTIPPEAFAWINELNLAISSAGRDQRVSWSAQMLDMDDDPHDDDDTSHDAPAAPVGTADDDNDDDDDGRSMRAGRRTIRFSDFDGSAAVTPHEHGSSALLSPPIVAGRRLFASPSPSTALSHSPASANSGPSSSARRSSKRPRDTDSPLQEL